MHSASIIEKYSPIYDFNTLLQKKDQSILSALLPKKNQDPNSPCKKQQQQDILKGEKSQLKIEEKCEDQNKQQSQKQELLSLVLKETLHIQNNQHSRLCSLLDNEYFYLNQIQSPYIIQLTSEIQRNSTSCYFTLEKGICDMYDRTFRENPYSAKGVNLNQIRLCLKQIAFALQYLHSELKVSHNDVKPENIIMFSENLYKLADFGYAKQIERIDIYSNDLYNKWKYRCKEYMAPELIRVVNNNRNSPQRVNRKIGLYQSYIDESKTDIFALGVSLFVMVFSVLPYKTEEGAFYEDEIFQYLENKNSYKYFWMNYDEILKAFACEEKETGEDFGLNQLKDLLENMLCHNPNERYNILEVLLHPWIQNVNQIKENNQSLDSSPFSN